MDNNSDGKLLIMQATIDDNRKASDEKIKTYDSKLDKLTEMIENMMVKNQNLN